MSEKVEAKMLLQRLSRPHCAKCKDRKCLSQIYYDFPCAFWADYADKTDIMFKRLVAENKKLLTENEDLKNENSDLMANDVEQLRNRNQELEGRLSAIVKWHFDESEWLERCLAECIDCPTRVSCQRVKKELGALGVLLQPNQKTEKEGDKK